MYTEYKVRVYSYGTDSDRTVWLNADGQYHRLDGPAVEYLNGRREWFLNGHRHRDDGPAIEHSDGSKSWFFDNLLMTEEEFNLLMTEEEFNLLMTEEEFNLALAPSCEGKIVEIDGKKYKLTEV